MVVIFLITDTQLGESWKEIMMAFVGGYIEKKQKFIINKWFQLVLKILWNH